MSLVAAIFENLLEFLPITVVEEHEIGVYLCWGKYKKSVDPGGYRTIWPAEKIIVVNAQAQDLPIQNVDMVLGNDKVWTMDAAIAYTIDNAYLYMLATREPDELLTTAAKSVILSYKGGDRIVDDTSKVEEEISDKLHVTAEQWGIAVLRFKFVTMAPCKVFVVRGGTSPPLLPAYDD